MAIWVIAIITSLYIFIEYSSHRPLFYCRHKCTVYPMTNSWPAEVFEKNNSSFSSSILHVNGVLSCELMNEFHSIWENFELATESIYYIRQLCELRKIFLDHDLSPLMFFQSWKNEMRPSIDRNKFSERTKYRSVKKLKKFRWRFSAPDHLNRSVTSKI